MSHHISYCPGGFDRNGDITLCGHKVTDKDRTHCGRHTIWDLNTAEGQLYAIKLAEEADKKNKNIQVNRARQVKQMRENAEMEKLRKRLRQEYDEQENEINTGTLQLVTRNHTFSNRPTSSNRRTNVPNNRNPFTIPVSPIQTRNRPSAPSFSPVRTQVPRTPLMTRQQEIASIRNQIQLLTNHLNTIQPEVVQHEEQTYDNPYQLHEQPEFNQGDLIDFEDLREGLSDDDYPQDSYQ